MSRIEKAMEKAREQSKSPSRIAHVEILADLSEPKPSQHFQQVPVSGERYSQPADSPQTDSQLHEANKIDMTSPRLIAVNDYNVAIAEEYRKLKSTIVQLVNKEPAKNFFLITSSIGGEGKSMTALNLAISLAQEHGKKVLLIDADLRKPSIAKYLGITPKDGLTEYLRTNMELDELFIETGLGGLTCLPAGKSVDNPVELYSSQRMRDLISLIKERFSDGYIIIDSSPVLPFAEARILATLVDGVVYIIKEGATSMKDIEEGLNSLYGAKVVGLVYNQATTASLAGGYHYYYYNYDYKRRYGYGHGYMHNNEQKKKDSIMTRLKKTNRTSKLG